MGKWKLESQEAFGKHGDNQEKVGKSWKPKVSSTRSSQMMPNPSPHQTTPCLASGRGRLQAAMVQGAAWAYHHGVAPGGGGGAGKWKRKSQRVKGGWEEDQ